MSCVPEWTIFYYLNWSYIPLNLIVLFHPQERTEVAKVGGWCPGSYALSECLPYKGGGSPGFQLVFTSNRIFISWNNEYHSQASSFMLHIQFLPHSNLLLKTTYTDWNMSCFSSVLPQLLSSSYFPGHYSLSSCHSSLYGLSRLRSVHKFCGPGSSVGIATDYELDGPGIESRWGKIFRRPDRPWGPPSLLYNEYRVFPGDRKRPRHDANPSPPSSAEV